nr:Sel1 repeat family protein [Aeromonas sp.]
MLAPLVAVLLLTGCSHHQVASRTDSGIDEQLIFKSWREEPLGEVQQAAEQGDADAQGTLGEMYKDGQTVPQDLKQAYAWYSVAVTNRSSMDLIYVMERESVAEKLTPTALAEAQVIADRYIQQYPSQP